MKLHIVIPVHNQHDYYAKCLFSIFKTYPVEFYDITIHVIDMASEPPIKEIPVDAYPNISAKVTRFEENKGVTFPWNYGIKTALEDDAGAVCVCNSDIVFGEKAIENCLRAIWEHSKFVVFPMSVQGGPMRDDFEAESNRLAKLPLEANMKATGGFAGWCFFLSRYVLDTIGLFDEQFTLWYQDTDYHWRLAEAGITPLEIQNCLIHHFESRTILSLPQQFEFKGWRAEDHKRFDAKWRQGKNTASSTT